MKAVPCRYCGKEASVGRLFFRAIKLPLIKKPVGFYTGPWNILCSGCCEESFVTEAAYLQQINTKDKVAMRSRFNKKQCIKNWNQRNDPSFDHTVKMAWAIEGVRNSYSEMIVKEAGAVTDKNSTEFLDGLARSFLFRTMSFSKGREKEVLTRSFSFEVEGKD